MTRKKKKNKKKKRPRTVRRDLHRKLDKLAEQRRKLYALEAGGHLDRPIEVAATSQIDGLVRELRCAGCDEPVLIDHETGTVHAGRVTRTIRLKCRQCGEVRNAYFAVRALLN